VRLLLRSARRGSGHDECGDGALTTARYYRNVIEIETRDGLMPAYVARPSGDGPFAAVILLQEIFGITPELQHIADMLAAEGYLTVLPALFHRTDPHFLAPYDTDGMTRGRAAVNVLSHDDVRSDIRAAIDWVRGQPDATGEVATWGFCWGGSVAFMSATFDDIRAAISFYGAQIVKSPYDGRPPMLDYTPKIQAPLFLVFGGMDQSISGSDIQTIQDTLIANEKAFSLTMYREEGHAFFRFAGTPQAAVHAPEAWQRVLAFLQNAFAVGTDDQIDGQ
jgi:carboxymethylenebutenolidase